MAGNAPNERLTREQTTRTALEMEAPAADWKPMAFTTAPPARPGMEQRWVRCRIAQTEDVANVLRRRQQGWTPRPAESVPKTFALLVRRFGDFGDVIQNQDSVLMERPLEYGVRMRAYIAAKTQRLDMAVRGFIDERMPRQHGTQGGAIDELNVQTTVGSGRIPHIPD